MDEQYGSVGKGFLGAVLGSIPGIVLWIILGYFNIVAALAGFVIAFGILMGYIKFGKVLNGAGILLCIFVMLVSVYVGVHLSWSISFYQWMPDLYNSVFGLYGILAKRGLTMNFLGDLGLGYFFALLGSFNLFRRMH